MIPLNGLSRSKEYRNLAGCLLYFKSKKRSRASFYLANDTFSVGDHFLDVPKLGRVNMAEKLRFSGKILSARISKTAAWWFVSITIEMPDDLPLNTYPPIGIDAGLNRLATLSDGRQYENQRPLVHQLKKLRRLNKELARRTKDGKNWLKTKDTLGRAHYEIACIRLDWLHKLTTEIATTSGIVAVEDLHVKGLIRNRCLSRAFSDAAVGKLLDLLENKVAAQGSMLLKVDRFFPSSQLCHCCGRAQPICNLLIVSLSAPILTVGTSGTAMKTPVATSFWRHFACSAST